MKKIYLLLSCMALSFTGYSQIQWGASLPCTKNPYCNNDPDRGIMSQAVVFLFYDANNNGVNDPGDDTRTGVFIANNRVTNSPYILTAYHSFRTDKLSSYKLILRGIKQCNGSQSSIVLANPHPVLTIETYDNVNDVLLLRVYYPDLYPDFNPYFLGWTVNNKQPTDVKSFHHPAGDALSVSYLSNATQVTRGFTSKRQWEFDVTDGILEPGSSGGPVIDQYNRIIGLNWEWTSNYPTCSNYKTVKFYSSDLSRVWCTLQPYLDPGNTGITAMNGRYWNGSVTTVSPNLQGPTVLCSGDPNPQKFELKNFLLAKNSSTYTDINWTPLNGTQSGFYDESYAFNLNNSDGEHTITASYDHCGTTRQYTKKLWKGRPSNSYITVDTKYACPQSYVTLTANYSKPMGITQHKWTMLAANGSTISGPTNYYNVQVYTGGYGFGSTVLKYESANICGWNNNWVSGIIVENNSGCGYFTISPNPTEEYFTISKDTKATSGSNNTPSLSESNPSEYCDNNLTIEIFDLNQQLQKKFYNQKPSENVNVAGIKPGHYVVRISCEKIIENHHLLIE